MNAGGKKSSTRKIGVSPITIGRWTADFYRTTGEIAYHCELRDSLKDQESKEIQQEIINKRVAHLRKIERKLGEIEE